MKEERVLNQAPCGGKLLFFGCGPCISWLALLTDGHSLSRSDYILLGYFPNESYKQSWDMVWALDEGAMQLSNQIVMGERSFKDREDGSI